MARYNKIRKMDISNGPGVRVSIFMQGCHFHCPGCFNPETHDFEGGKPFTEETIAKVLELAEKEYIVGLSILGGEPFHPANISGTLQLARAFKKKYPDKTIWAWTGYRFEEHIQAHPVCQYLDVLVDGPFVEKLHDFRLEWRGSSNQRVIDVKKTRETNELCLVDVKF